MVLITLTMVRGKNLDSILNSVLSDEPSWRLRQPQNAKRNDTRGNHLAPNGNSPGNVTIDVTAAVDDPTSDDATDVPGTVVQTSNGASPVGMRHLANVARGGDTAEADTEAEDEATAEELTSSGGCSLDTCSDDDYDGAGEHAPSSAEEIVYGGGEEHGGNGTDVVHRKDDTGRRALRRPVIVSSSAFSWWFHIHVEVALVCLHTVDTTEKTTVIPVLPKLATSSLSSRETLTKQPQRYAQARMKYNLNIRGVHGDNF